MEMKKYILIFLTLLSLSTFASAVGASNFEESVEIGKSVYATNCASCHGVEGEGAIGPALNSKVTLDSLGLESIRHTVETGVPGTAMPALEGVLSGEEIEGVVNFIFAEWADMKVVGIEMWPWEITFVIMGAIWALMGLYYVVRV